MVITSTERRKYDMKVIKRNGTVTDFDNKKIKTAILKAMKYGSGIVKPSIADSIASEIYTELHDSNEDNIPISKIEELVFNKLIAKKQKLTARAYEGYRSVQEFKRTYTALDKDIEGIIDGTNTEAIDENSNKNAKIASTQRDLMAGEYSKDYSRRHLLPSNVLQAHDEGIIHMHDLDYFAQHIPNCFSGDTEFITNTGVKKFNECSNGQIVSVIDKDGIWRKATVKKYDKQKLQTITLQSGRTVKTIRCTSNHRWILKNGTVTTNLKINDRLILTKELNFSDQFEIDANYFCLGFVLGDGSDFYNKNGSEGVTVRLCGNKKSYISKFIEAGYKLSTQTFDNGDIIVYKNGKAFKQEFIKNHIWTYLSNDALVSLFSGYYAADGYKDRNGISTSNDDLAQMIRDISCLCGYYITSEKFEIRNTNFKNNAKLYTFRFLTSQPSNRNWIVKSIDRNDLHLYDVWCVEEPITHSFTLNGGIVTGNCCLVNMKDILNNGTVINRKMIEKPKSFRTACTVATQVVQQVANGQYGGQTFSIAHLAPFVRISYDKYYDKYINRGMSKEDAKKFADEDLKQEIKDGIQTIQYQINTFATSNGQAPFLSIFMYISEEPEYEKETALLIEEILRQRIIGMKNEAGAYITPAFPKLLYVTDENNIHEDSEYYYLTKLAAECVSKRMLPDFISAKKMKEQYDGEVFPCMGCRSFLLPYKDPETKKYQWYGRFNQGVVTINLVDVGLSANKDINDFWKIFDERLELCHQALQLRHERLMNTSVEISPIHWKYGGISRLKTTNFNDLLFNDYSSISLGYAGLYECVMALIGESHTTEKGHALAVQIMQYMKDKCEEWRTKENIGYSLYGSPIESTTYKFARCLKKRFGIIKDITDHDYVTNSYHVSVREEINAYDKLKFESEFQNISSGGCISYIETCNLSQNVDVVLDIIKYMYDNIRYAELNGKFDYCQECGFSGEMQLDDNNEWYCPNCGNRNKNKLNVCRRTCGYLGDNFWNTGRTAEIKDRYVHIDNKPMQISITMEN